MSVTRQLTDSCQPICGHDNDVDEGVVVVVAVVVDVSCFGDCGLMPMQVLGRRRREGN